MRGHIKTLSIVSVILLLSVACGGGSDRDVTATNQTNESSNSETDSSRESLTESVEEDSAPVESEPSSSSSTTANENGETSTAEDEPAYEMFGDIVWPCNPGTASGATDQGVSDKTIEAWKHLAEKKNWRIVQLPNGYYQTEYRNIEEDTWYDVTRRETVESAEAAIDGSIDHYKKRIDFLKGPKVVKTFK